MYKNMKYIGRCAVNVQPLRLNNGAFGHPPMAKYRTISHKKELPQQIKQECTRIPSLCDNVPSQCHGKHPTRTAPRTIQKNKVDPKRLYIDPFNSGIRDIPSFYRDIVARRSDLLSLVARFGLFDRNAVFVFRLGSILHFRLLA